MSMRARYTKEPSNSASGVVNPTSLIRQPRHRLASGLSVAIRIWEYNTIDAADARWCQWDAGGWFPYVPTASARLNTWDRVVSGDVVGNVTVRRGPRENGRAVAFPKATAAGLRAS